MKSNKINLQFFAKKENEDLEEGTKGLKGEEIEKEKEKRQEGKEDKEIDIDSIIAEKIAEKEKEWQSETDRRVNQALEKQKELASLSEEEKLEVLRKEKEEEIREKEEELELRIAEIDMIKTLKEEDFLGAEELFDVKNYKGDNFKKLEKDIRTIKDFINDEVEKQLRNEKDKLLKGGATPGSSRNEKKDTVDYGDSASIIAEKMKELRNR